MKVFLVEDHDFPAVDFRMMVHTGTTCDPADKVGLAAITTRLLRTGGSGNVSGDLMDEKLETMGSVLSSNAAEDSVNIDMSLLKERLV